MPQPKKGPRYGGSPAHHNMMMANLATELFRHGRINTTLGRAKAAQPLAEKMITFARRGDVAARREVLKVIRDRDVVHKLFADIGPAFAERNGGYTRLLKTGPRKGDAAPMALLELVEGITVQGEGVLEEQPARRWSLRRRKGGTVSTAAQARLEERAAAVDRGEDPAYVEDEPAMAEAVPAGALSARADDEDTPQDSPDASTDDDEERPQADPAEVEARLAAEDDTAAADDADGDADEDKKA